MYKKKKEEEEANVCQPETLKRVVVWGRLSVCVCSCMCVCVCVCVCVYAELALLNGLHTQSPM